MTTKKNVQKFYRLSFCRNSYMFVNKLSVWYFKRQMNTEQTFNFLNTIFEIDKRISRNEFTKNDVFQCIKWDSFIFGKEYRKKYENN